VVRFSRYARQVTLLVRGRDLGASMSQYLIDQLSGIPNVDVRVRTQVVSLEADDRLRALVVRSGDSAEPVRLPAAALFICIGGMPRTDGAAGIGLATNAACGVPEICPACELQQCARLPVGHDDRL
jgi:thioredoxin reductase (NADPH)